MLYDDVMPRTTLYLEDDALAAAREYAKARGACVVKLDGLAAGKGVIVADDGAQAAHAVEELWRPGGKLLIEERLEGIENGLRRTITWKATAPQSPVITHPGGVNVTEDPASAPGHRSFTYLWK